MMVLKYSFYTSLSRIPYISIIGDINEERTQKRLSIVKEIFNVNNQLLMEKRHL